jgi:FAD/FMN-containing dehydrogenase/Fe-S oxidoreductase
LQDDDVIRSVYATDASVYREMPMGVAFPKNEADICKLVEAAREFGFPLIPRAAGTSLGGQVVGSGLVVDVSRFMTGIIEINAAEGYAKVEPGVVLDELNRQLAKVGKMFGPETSTSNRCTLGGMFGNNSCGSRSIVYGSTRDHVLETRAILSDGSVAVFGDLTTQQFRERCDSKGLEGKLYSQVAGMLSDPENESRLREGYPKASIRRRNTGYALDMLLDLAPFSKGGAPFNFCQLLAGSEGTLAFATEIKLRIVDALPPSKGVIAIHMHSIREAAVATALARKFSPTAVELLDRMILDCAAKNIEQQKNLFFVKDRPEALLIVEFHGKCREEVEESAQNLIDRFRDAGFGYHYPILYDADVSRVWALRKAGLGTLANFSGEAKAVACIEDTAVSVEDLPDYLDSFQSILDRYGKECVYYGHIGDGELHLRPLLDLKLGPEREIFRKLTSDVADLVKHHRGSLSGEHGDGRVRGSFIEKMVGAGNYQLLLDVKRCWDPNGIFNPGKITGVPDMTADLRAQSEGVEIGATHFRFSHQGSILKLAENCNGSGDCRKSHLVGGTMCPSYMATRDERDTTRARANLLRERLLHPRGKDPLADADLYEILDLCLSCKGCKSECPSNVDMATMKAEVLQHYYDSHGIPLRARLVAEFPSIAKVAEWLPGAGILARNPMAENLFKRIAGFTTSRKLPAIGYPSLRRWIRANPDELKPQAAKPIGSVVLFCDEFTNFSDQTIGIRAIQLVTALGYQVLVPEHHDSGRTHLSKGLVRRARQIAEANILALGPHVSESTPMIGLEPSAILSFRDEYPELVDPGMHADAVRLAGNTYLLEEWLAAEFKAGRIQPDSFHLDEREIVVHGHCHQKAIASIQPTIDVLSIPMNYRATLIPSGCCGMAGSFGYESEHYGLSMQIGDLVLFPAINKSPDSTTIVASGTSCRAQIQDGTGRKPHHPVDVLWEALSRH